MRSDLWPGQQSIGQNRGEALGQGRVPTRQPNKEAQENQGGAPGLNNANAGAVPQGQAAQAAGTQPGGQAGITNVPLIMGTHVPPPTNIQGLHWLSLA